MPGTDLFYPKPAAPRAPRAARQGFRDRGSAFRDQRSEVRGREEQNHHQSDPSGPSYLFLARSAQPAARSGFLGFLGFLPGSTVLVRRFSPEPHRRLSAVLTSDLFFSTVWKTFFHRVEKSPQSCSIVWKSGLKVVPLRGKNSPVFPRCGKLFSTVWNFFRRFFHGVELFPPVFPRCGTFSADFSTVWKTNQNAGSTSRKIILPHRRGLPETERKSKRPCPALSAVRSTWLRRISCEFWRGSYAKIHKESS